MLLGWMDEDRRSFVEDFSTKGEAIPGANIIQREIVKALDGEDYFINNKETGKPIFLTGIKFPDFIYYYKLWENFHYFGLPPGMNWLKDREWFFDLLKIFQKTYVDSNNFIDRFKNG